ncbi:hypothetical protein D3C72_1575730 [compost metagenome]
MPAGCCPCSAPRCRRCPAARRPAPSCAGGDRTGARTGWRTAARWPPPAPPRRRTLLSAPASRSRCRWPASGCRAGRRPSAPPAWGWPHRASAGSRTSACRPARSAPRPSGTAATTSRRCGWQSRWNPRSGTGRGRRRAVSAGAKSGSWRSTGWAANNAFRIAAAQGANAEKAVLAAAWP